MWFIRAEPLITETGDATVEHSDVTREPSGRLSRRISVVFSDKTFVIGNKNRDASVGATFMEPEFLFLIRRLENLNGVEAVVLPSRSLQDVETSHDRHHSNLLDGG